MGNRDDWLHLSNGVLYQGALKDGKPHGKGKVLFLDGDRSFTRNGAQEAWLWQDQMSRVAFTTASGAWT